MKYLYNLNNVSVCYMKWLQAAWNLKHWCPPPHSLILLWVFRGHNNSPGTYKLTNECKFWKVTKICSYCSSKSVKWNPLNLNLDFGMMCLLGWQSDGKLPIGFFSKNPVILPSLSGYLLTMCSTCKSCCLLSDANTDTFCHPQSVFFETKCNMLYNYV